jgi:hypothetical protein
LTEAALGGTSSEVTVSYWEVTLKMARTVEVPEYEVHDRVSVDPSRAARCS